MKRLVETAVLLGAAAAALSAQDVVNQINERGEAIRQEGRISEMDCATVTIMVSAGGQELPQQIDATRITEIEFHTGSSAFLSGLRRYQAGQYDEAVQQFARAAQDANAPAWTGQASLWYTALCHQERGNGQDMTATLGQLLQQSPNTFYVLSAYDLEVNAYLAANDGTRAAAAIQAAQQHMSGHSQANHRWQGRITLWRARTAYAQRNWAEALQLYRSLQSDRDPQAAKEANVMELRTLIDSGDLNGARTRGEGVAGNAANRSNDWLMTAAYNAIGAAQMETAPGEALKAFLRGVVLYNQSGQRNSEHEYAIAQAAIAAWRASATLAGQTKDEYRAYTNRLLGQLRDTYPSSGFVAQIQQAMQQGN